MIISDLNHLEVVSETTELVGGSYYSYYYPYKSQSNYSTIYQTAEAEAKAVSYKGDAVATAIATNSANVYQKND